MTLDFPAIIARESALLLEAASSVPLETQVPSCPGWDMAALVGHVGLIQTWSAQMLETRAQERLERKTLPPAPQGAAVLAYFSDATRRLVQALKTTDPATPMWTLTPQRVAACWARRQAHEVCVHRWDAQSAAGKLTAFDDELGADGVDELLEMHLALRPDKFKGDAGTVHLHATTGPGEWLLTLGGDGMTVEHKHAKGEVAARGPASQLYLWVWGRIPDTTLEVFGNRALLDRVQRLTAM
jgi:uncharacterized protein (TIGR03083 family)